MQSSHQLITLNKIEPGGFIILCGRRKINRAGAVAIKTHELRQSHPEKEHQKIIKFSSCCYVDFAAVVRTHTLQRWIKSRLLLFLM